jgi:hypothetical protein
VIVETDPFSALGTTAAAAAEEARVAGDWKKALELSRETLAYAPDSAGARGVRAAWLRKVIGEAFIACLSAAALAWLLQGLGVVFGEKGLHKVGAIVQAGVVNAVAGAVAALVLIPILWRVVDGKVRHVVAASTGFGVMFATWAVLRWGLEWNPIRAADNESLKAELATTLPYGDSGVFYDKDLRSLQALYDKYAESQADLEPLNRALQKQLALKSEFESTVRRFEEELADLVAAKMPRYEKRSKLETFKVHYSIRNVNTAAVDEAIRKLDAEATVAAKVSSVRRNTPKQGNGITIITRDGVWRGGRFLPKRPKASPPKKKPAPKKATPAPAKKKKR